MVRVATGERRERRRCCGVEGDAVIKASVGGVREERKRKGGMRRNEGRLKCVTSGEKWGG